MKRKVKTAISLLFFFTYFLIQGCTPDSKEHNPEPFKILWHIATQIEPLSKDLSAEERSQIGTLKGMVNGYYFNLLHGPQVLSYFPNRPLFCNLNFQHFNIEANASKIDFNEFGNPIFNYNNQILDVNLLQNFCQTQFNIYSASVGDQAAVYQQQLSRVFRNLNISEEQEMGKKVIAEIILKKTEFVGEGRDIEYRDLPGSYRVFHDNYIFADSIMTYQEPSLQGANDYFYFPEQDELAEKLDPRWYHKNLFTSFEFLTNQLNNFVMTPPKISIDIRHWDHLGAGGYETSISSMLNSGGANNFAGIVFEGGINQLVVGGAVHSFSRGAAWLLQNTSEDIYFLMPPEVSVKDFKTEYELDELTNSSTHEYFATLNQEINQIMNTSGSPVCNSRFNFIPPSYAFPIHPPTFPVTRNGIYARTVSGQITLMNEIRKEMCGN